MVNLSRRFVNISGLRESGSAYGRLEPATGSSYTAGVNPFILFLFLALPLAIGSAAADKAPVIGIWEGESKCTVPDSPCHDEHVIYTIQQASGGGLRVRADKVLNGERQYMGTLPCRYDTVGKRLTCVTEGAKPGDWVFTLSDNTMTGTLTLRNERQLYRRIRVQRQRESRK